MNDRELHILQIDVHLSELRVQDRFIRNPALLDINDFDVRPLIRTVKTFNLSIATYGTAARLLKSKNFDAICIVIEGFPNLLQAFPHRNPLRNIAGLPIFARLTTLNALLLKLVRNCAAPLLMFERLDSSVIDKRWYPLMRHCKYFFKRELPKSTVNAFLYGEHVAIEPWKNRIRYAKLIAKLRPYSVGLPEEILSVPLTPVKRDIDILWGGAVNISPVRERGLDRLRKLSSMGYRVEICERKVSKSEYYKLIRRSHLVWSPEGTGWTCYKHYESGAMESVPVISYPTVWQDKPLIDGVHCLYYDPEEDGLITTVRRALEDKEKLLEMGRRSRPFVLRYHTDLSSYLRCTFEALQPAPADPEPALDAH